MTLHIDLASPRDADVIATMVGELLHEIMSAVDEKVFRFDLPRTAARARTWLHEGAYTALVARVGEEPVGFLALYQGYALYAEGTIGTIPELYVRPANRSQGIGSALLTECKKIGQMRGWRRLEVTTPPLPQFARTLSFYEGHGFTVSGGRKLRLELT